MGSAGTSPGHDTSITTDARAQGAVLSPAGTQRVLRRSADRKVTNLPSPNGKTAKIANSFGLPAGREYSCPGATDTCQRVCYAGKLEKLYKGVRELLVGNLQALAGLDHPQGLGKVVMRARM